MLHQGYAPHPARLVCGWAAGVAMHSSRVMVTGAAGFIGSHLCRRLVEDGHRVSGIDSLRSGDWARVDPSVSTSTADIAQLDEADLADALTDHDLLFHLAAEKYHSPGSHPDAIVAVNIAATGRLYRAAAIAGIRKVVFTSSLYAYGGRGPSPMRETDVPEPRTYYGLSKVAGEHLLRVAASEHGVAGTVARLFFIYGPGQFAEGGYKSVIVKNFERLRAGKPPTIFGDGLQALDYVFVDDCIDALIRLADPAFDGETLNVASGHGTTIVDLTRRMLGVAGLDLEPITLPPDETAGTIRVGDPAHCGRRTGWNANTALDDGLLRVWNWMESQGG